MRSAIFLLALSLLSPGGFSGMHTFVSLELSCVALLFCETSVSCRPSQDEGGHGRPLAVVFSLHLVYRSSEGICLNPYINY
jgi:hypothetical protein